VETEAPWVTARCDDSYLYVNSNGMPGWFMRSDFRNEITAQSHHFTIPLVPRAAPAPTEVPFLGTIGVSITGVPIYAPNEAATWGTATRRRTEGSTRATGTSVPTAATTSTPAPSVRSIR
jgi:hypothetical protein